VSGIEFFPTGERPRARATSAHRDQMRETKASPGKSIAMVAVKDRGQTGWKALLLAAFAETV
jgi:hypothetical protein